MNMTKIVIKPASRKGIVPLIVIYSESGCGKTYSSLLAARGLAGKAGKIVIVDTENGRGELYADIPEIGGYDCIRLEAPFTPARYIEAINIVQRSGAAVGILDSGSHEWEGVDGVLDLAAANEQKSGKPGLHNWKMPKFEHAKFVNELTRSSIPWIVCLRAKFKTRQAKDQGGKTVIVKDDHTSPIQAEDFIFEATCHGEIMPDHTLRLTKWSHPSLKGCFPVNGPITIQTGEAIAKWCSAPSDSAKEMPPTAPVQPHPIGIGQLKNKLWTATMKIHNGESVKLEHWLKDNLVFSGKLSELTAEVLPDVIDRSIIRIQEMKL